MRIKGKYFTKTFFILRETEFNELILRNCLGILGHQSKQVTAGGTKRVRLLIRQPRIKKESESGRRASPESEPGSPHIIPSLSTSTSLTPPITPSLNIPPKHDQSLDDPAASSSPTTPIPAAASSSSSSASTYTSSSGSSTTNLLTVPQPSYLVKQHSHPLLPSQQQPSASGHTYWIQRQHSNPEYPGRTSPKSTIADTIPLIKIGEGGNNQQQQHHHHHHHHHHQQQQESGKSTSSSNSSGSGLRIIPAELLRSSSTPQVIRLKLEYGKVGEYGPQKFRLLSNPKQCRKPEFFSLTAWNWGPVPGKKCFLDVILFQGQSLVEVFRRISNWTWNVIFASVHLWAVNPRKKSPKNKRKKSLGKKSQEKRCLGVITEIKIYQI